jgi:NADH:ubiquinone oxidoreductase subunit F (NADH-binding)/Pyruvate/2-oxoacid:ferredoxin oxidoreductase delta subunit
MDALIIDKKTFLIDYLLQKAGDNNLRNPDSEIELALLRREDVIKPVIYIGCGTCGLGAGSDKTIIAVKNYLFENKIDAEIVEVGCIGLCSAEPLMDVQLPGRNRISFQNVTFGKVENILNCMFQDLPLEENVLGQFSFPGLKKYNDVRGFFEHPFFAPQTRIVLKNCGLINPVSIEEYIAHGGYSELINVLKVRKPSEVCNMIEKSGLRGRGGGGFLTAMKWKLAAEIPSGQRYLICNADEGDPGAFMDRAVIEGDPHRLIEGMTIAAFAFGATKGYVYIRAEYPLAVRRLRESIVKAREFGFLGKNIFNTGADFDIAIKMGAGAFVCGEETALINSIEGKRGMPRPRPPYPSASGLFGKPTVINNVETLANIPGILEKGIEWYSKLGTKTSKGTKVFALSGKVKLTGLVEIPMGTTIRDIIFKIAGGIREDKKFKAVQIGGPSGGCITNENLDIQVDYESLIKVGAMMGSGGLVVMDEETCMVDIARFFMSFIQHESCGKCIPCREGTKRMLEILESITQKPVNGAGNTALERMKGIIQLEKLSKVIRDTSLCGLGNSAPNPVISTLRWFRDEYEAHIFERICPAGVCTEMRKFKIEVDKCSGCTACVKKCPSGAIIGTRKAPHFIVEEKCIACGACIEVCRSEAVYIE